MPILNVCNLCKTYQAGEAEVKALDNVSFTVEKGEFVSIIGPSGSGKSTLLHILAGIDRPTSGKVYVDGEDIYAKSEKELAYYRRRKAGLIYQFYNLVPTLTVEEVKDIVESELGGSISVTSEDGCTDFTIRIPKENLEVEA